MKSLGKISASHCKSAHAELLGKSEGKVRAAWRALVGQMACSAGLRGGQEPGMRR